MRSANRDGEKVLCTLNTLEALWRKFFGSKRFDDIKSFSAYSSGV